MWMMQLIVTLSWVLRVTIDPMNSNVRVKYDYSFLSVSETFCYRCIF